MKGNDNCRIIRNDENNHYILPFLCTNQDNERTKLIVQTFEKEEDQEVEEEQEQDQFQQQQQQVEPHRSSFLLFGNVAEVKTDAHHLPIVTTTNTTRKRNNENHIMTNKIQRTKKWKRHVPDLLWFLYFLSAVIVILIGMYHNQNPVRYVLYCFCIIKYQ